MLRANSFVYKAKTSFDPTPAKLNKELMQALLSPRNILLKLAGKFYIFSADTWDFSNGEIASIYEKRQIYINKKLDKVSVDFKRDYLKIKMAQEKLVWENRQDIGYFELDLRNLFEIAENDVREILKENVRWSVLDVGSGRLLYEDIFADETIEYTGVDPDPSVSWENVTICRFEDYESKKAFDSVLFLRSINHFENTKDTIKKALRMLKSWGFLFVVDNEAFWELKLESSIFEPDQNHNFEHHHNHSLATFKECLDLGELDVIYEKWVDEDSANQWYIMLKKR